MSRGGIALIVAAVSLAGASAHAEPGALLALRLDPALACPDAAAVTAALARQALGIDEQAPTSLTLSGGPEGGVALVLRDGEGAVLLDRHLPGDACEALADAVALLVQRRLEGVGWAGDLPGAPTAAEPTPPPATPPPATPPARRVPRAPRAALALSADAGVVLADGIDGQPAAPGPAAAVTLSARLVALSLSAAWIGRPELPAAGGTLAVDEVPLSLDAAFVLRQPRFALALGPRFAVTILHAVTTGLPRVESRTRAALRLGPALSLTVLVLSSVYVRVGVAALGLASGWDLRVAGVGVVARQSDWALEGGAAVGLRLPI